MRTSEGHSVRQRASTIIRLVSDISGGERIFATATAACTCRGERPHRPTRRKRDFRLLAWAKFKVAASTRDGIAGCDLIVGSTGECTLIYFA